MTATVLSKLPSGYRRAHYAVVGSTNDLARAAAEAGNAPDGLLITADYQQTGRGRAGRAWYSPESPLHVTIVKDLPPQREAAYAQASLVTGVAVHGAVAFHLPENLRPALRLKWPNDLLFRTRKVGGILVETTVRQGQSPAAALIGIGLNIAGVPAAASETAIALHDIGANIDRDGLLVTLVERFDGAWRQWVKEGFAPLKSAWLDRGPPFGQPIMIRDGGERRAGSFAGLDADGALLFQPADRPVQRITVADVEHL